MLRPGIIQPRHGIKSKTRLYRVGAPKTILENPDVAALTK
jgi:hypothetical protein